MRIINVILILFFIACNKTQDKDQNKTVYVLKTQTGYTLVRNKVPFEVNGAAGSHKYMKELSEFGGNTIRLYTLYSWQLNKTFISFLHT